jgi:hypothetical protein
VRSRTRRGQSYELRPEGVRQGRGPLQLILRCSCQSGMARPSEPVPCWHAALVGRRFEREGWARWHDGSWWMTMLGLAVMRSGPPNRKKMRGPCPICKTPVSVEVAVDEEPKAIAAEHEPSCRKEWRHRQRELAKRPLPDIDLWER